MQRAIFGTFLNDMLDLRKHSQAPQFNPETFIKAMDDYLLPGMVGGGYASFTADGPAAVTINSDDIDALKGFDPKLALVYEASTGDLFFAFEGMTDANCYKLDISGPTWSLENANGITLGANQLIIGTGCQVDGEVCHVLVFGF